MIHNAIVNASQHYATLEQKQNEALNTGILPLLTPGPVVQSKGVGFFNLAAIIAFGLGVALLGGFVGYNVVQRAPATTAASTS